MKPGDVVLLSVPQFATGTRKLRPAMVLVRLPGVFQNTLVCGITTHLDDLHPDWDELLDPSSPEFRMTGLHYPSALRLSYLYAAGADEIKRIIGQVDLTRLGRLRRRLAQLLQS
jgi:mRNA interferase MazF